jgi:hypothetical protein
LFTGAPPTPLLAEEAEEDAAPPAPTLADALTPPPPTPLLAEEEALAEEDEALPLGPLPPTPLLAATEEEALLLAPLPPTPLLAATEEEALLLPPPPPTPLLADDEDEDDDEALLLAAELLLPATQAPDWHVPPAQADPFGAFALAPHTPFCGSQTLWTWHSAGSGQTTLGPAEQIPLWQVSPVVQPFASSQLDPVKRVQTPSAVAPRATEQASHAPPLHAVVQQTPSAQNAPGQSALLPQGLPRTAGTGVVNSTLFAAQTCALDMSPKPASTRPSGSNVVVLRARFGASIVPSGVQTSRAGE